MVGVIVNQLFFLKRDKLYDTIADLERIKVGEYAERALDLIWKSGFQYTANGLEQAYKESSSRREEIEKNMNKLKDWRLVVNKYFNSIPENEKKFLFTPPSMLNKNYMQNT
jgi:hypothetical protein